jgi:hypothetical protein
MHKNGKTFSSEMKSRRMKSFNISYAKKMNNNGMFLSFFSLFNLNGGLVSGMI